MNARVWAEAAGFAVFLIAGFLALELPKFPSDAVVWWTVAAVFLVVLVIEGFLVAPYRHAEALMLERNGLEKDLDRIRKEVEQNATNKIEALLAKAVDMIRESKNTVEPIGAIISVADELQTEEEVERLCEAFRVYAGHSPFSFLELKYEINLKGLRLAFVKDARYHTAITPVRNENDATTFAEVFWRYNHLLKLREFDHEIEN